MTKTIQIPLSPELEQQLFIRAQEQNTTIESLALQSFQEHYGMTPDILTANINILIEDYQQFINHLQQKYPDQTSESAILSIISAEFQELRKTQPLRWQNFQHLKFLCNIGKTTLQMGEHFTEENFVDKMAKRKRDESRSHSSKASLKRTDLSPTSPKASAKPSPNSSNEPALTLY